MGDEQLNRYRKYILRVLLCVAVLIAGIGARAVLIAFKTPPKQAEIHEMSLRVEVQKVQPADVPVMISGFGEVRALNVVMLTAKVAGEVVEVHPRLEVGEVIPAGELLYRIDARDYQAGLAQAQAQIERLNTTITLLKQQAETDRTRLETQRRTLDIASQEFQRDKKLYEEEDVGSETIVNLSEINYRKVQDAFDQVAEAVDLYPLRIREAEQGLKAVQAAAELARLNLERTEVRAPFNARLKQVQIEAGQAVAPGVPVLAIADDSTLEIAVPLDSRDARNWLRFEDGAAAPDAPDSDHWFGELEPVECKVTWTEDPQGLARPGILNRVQKYDPATRTVTVAVRLDNGAGRGSDETLPLVEGMYCRVEIPGRTMAGVYRLPRWAVGFDGTVYVAVDGRLKRTQTRIMRTEGEETFVFGGVAPGDLVIVTRMANPLPDTRVEYETPAMEPAA